MGEVRPGHAAVFRARAERLRAIAARLRDQAERLPSGGEQSFLLGQAREFVTAARRFETDASVIDGLGVGAADGARTVFVSGAHPANDADARAGRVRLGY
jgi:hypothetical protein